MFNFWTSKKLDYKCMPIPSAHKVLVGQDLNLRVLLTWQTLLPSLLITSYYHCQENRINPMLSQLKLELG